jgi:similar to stage IV sporulation protein
LIGKEGEEIPVAAKGKVWGETWYKSHVELPLETTFNVFNGKEKQKYSILLGNLEIPVWGFGKPKFKEYEMENSRKKVHFLKWELPIAFESKTIREREKITRAYKQEEAVKIALEMAKKDIKSSVNDDATIKDEKILHKVIENGKVILDIHFKVIENIAEEQPIKPIIQGDS